MYKVIIVEDEANSREYLKHIVAEYCKELTIVAVAGTVDEAAAAIRTHKPDFIFLDIEMQTGTGFDVLQQFPEADFDVIFTTAYDHYAIKAIKFSAADYLLKPVEIEELQAAVQKVIDKRKSKSGQSSLQQLLKNLQAPKAEQSITLSTADGYEFIPLHQIIRIEASGPYSHFFIKNSKKIMVSRNLKEYETLLNEHGFFRIHNSHIINLKEVKKMIKTDGGYAVMTDDSMVSISPKKKEDFMAQMAQRLV